MLLYLSVIALALALLGALLHPIELAVRALPGDASGFLLTLGAAKGFIANLIFWSLLGVLFAMWLLVVTSRARRQMATSSNRTGNGTNGRTCPFALPDNRPVKMAVAITAYNEEDAIGAVVKEFRAQPGVVEVIVIDNNSRDRTSEMAAVAGARVVLERRQGYGYACMRGLQEGLAKPEVEAVALVEGDSTFDARDLAKFQAYIRQADMVVGTRMVPGLVEAGSQMDYFFGWGNLFISGLLRLRFFDVQFLGAARLSDVGCTYRVVRRQALERILPELVVGGNHFSPHMMLVSLAHKQSMIEIPVTFRKRIGVSKGASGSMWKGWWVGVSMVWHIMTYRPHVRRPAVTRTPVTPVGVK